MTINQRPTQLELGVRQTEVRPAVQRDKRRTARWLIAVLSVILVIGVAVPVFLRTRSTQPVNSGQPVRYLGVYERSTPLSYAGVASFAATTKVRPDLVMYYSSWLEPFQASFAATAYEHGATPVVQINPSQISLAAIAAGQYDDYLDAYAQAVLAYGHPVIMSFGHEMNGSWYSWGYTRTSPATFVAAWRHVVTLFREQGATNATWLWTVNRIVTDGGIPSPGPWWPGSSYVTWVGIDGYYSNPSMTFASVFGPTIAAVRELTGDPILIAETAAAPAAIQPAKIADLFEGIRTYGLLGFVWFGVQPWNLSGSAAIGAYRRGAEGYERTSP
jgi:glycosyl hydrolase family 26